MKIFIDISNKNCKLSFTFPFILDGISWKKHFVMVSTEGGKLNIGAIQHNQSTWLKNIGIFVLRITCTLIQLVI